MAKNNKKEADYTLSEIITNTIITLEEINSTLKNIQKWRLHLTQHEGDEKLTKETLDSLEDLEAEEKTNKENLERKLSQWLKIEGLGEEEARRKANEYTETIKNLHKELLTQSTDKYIKSPFPVTEAKEIVDAKRFEEYIFTILSFTMSNLLPIQRAVALNQLLKTLRTEGVKPLIDHTLSLISPGDNRIYEYSEKPKNVTPHTAEKFSMVRGMVANKMINNPKVYDSEYSLNNPVDFAENTPVYFHLNIKEEAAITGTKNITQFDKAVLDSACSLLEAGNIHFTAKMIYRLLKGNPKSSDIKPTQKQLEDIDKSIQKMRNTRLSIDFTKEAQLKGYDVDSAITDDDLINVSRTKIRLSGNEVTAYEFNSEPLLLKYSKLSKQISTLDAELLDDQMTFSVDNISIRNYLLGRIELAKVSGLKNIRIIKLESLADKCQLNIVDRFKRRRYIEVVEDLLNIFINKKYIHEYEKRGRGTEVRFELKVNKKRI